MLWFCVYCFFGWFVCLFVCLFVFHEDLHCVYTNCFPFCEKHSSYKAQVNSEGSVLNVRIVAIFFPQFHLLKKNTQENLKGFTKQNDILHGNATTSSICLFPYASTHGVLRICLCHSVRKVNRKFIK